MVEPKVRINLLKKAPAKTERTVGRRSAVKELRLGSFLKRVFTRQRMYKREQVNQKQLDILEECHKNNLSVERPISFTVGKRGDMLFLNSGKELNAFRFKLKSEKEQEQILRQLLDIISRMHNLGIAHDHPHLGNIVIDEKGKVTLVDFKHAKKEKIKWQRSNEILYFFKNDYLNLVRSAFELGLTDINVRHFFEPLINNYPCSAQTKSILKRVVFELVDGFYANPAKYGF